MGVKRFLWRATCVGRTIDTVRNIVEEGSIVDGYKKTLKEDICEDFPLTKAIYDVGTYDGAKTGYVQASAEYERKLLQQADKFLEQKKIYETERAKYEQLLDEYEAEIEKLESKVEKTEVEKAYLQELLLRERQLRKLVSA